MAERPYSVALPLSDPARAVGAVVATMSVRSPYARVCGHLGPNDLFGVVSEPLDRGVQGPLIVMV